MSVQPKHRYAASFSGVVFSGSPSWLLNPAKKHFVEKNSKESNGKKPQGSKVCRIEHYNPRPLGIDFKFVKLYSWQDISKNKMEYIYITPIKSYNKSENNCGNIHEFYYNNDD